MKQAWPYYFNPHGYIGVTNSAIISGTLTTNDVLTITITDASLSTSPQNVNYTVQGGDTLTDIAEGLRDEINNNSVLSDALITATSTGSTVTVTMRSHASTTYSWSVTGSQTESIAFIGNGNASNKELFAEAFANPSYLLASLNRNKMGHSDNPFVTTFC